MDYKIKLKHPVKIEGENITTLVMRPPKVRDRLIAEKQGVGAAEKEMHFIANLCNVQPDVLLEIELSDYVKLQEAVNDFLS